MVQKNWGALAKAVAQRRRELGLSQAAVHQAGGPSDVVISRIEETREPRPRDDTVNKLDAPLQWQPGSAQVVLAGGQAQPLQRPLDLAEVGIDDLLGEIRRRVVRDDAQGWPPQFRLGDDEWHSERVPRAGQG
jgi:hypothetical protein